MPSIYTILLKDENQSLMNFLPSSDWKNKQAWFNRSEVLK